MILWINGAWGSGKTQTAAELHKRIEHSFIYDPEEIGYCLRKTTPKPLWHDDFQDNPLWRLLNLTMLKHLLCSYDGIIIVPMTVINEAYYTEIIGGLRESGCDVRHFVLSCSEQTIYRRLHSRFERKNSWAGSRALSCIKAFQSSTFENKIITDKMTVEQTAEEVARLAGIALLPRKSRFLTAVSRFKTQVEAIKR